MTKTLRGCALVLLLAAGLAHAEGPKEAAPLTTEQHIQLRAIAKAKACAGMNATKAREQTEAGAGAAIVAMVDGGADQLEVFNTLREAWPTPSRDLCAVWFHD